MNKKKIFLGLIAGLVCSGSVVAEEKEISTAERYGAMSQEEVRIEMDRLNRQRDLLSVGLQIKDIEAKISISKEKKRASEAAAKKDAGEDGVVGVDGEPALSEEQMRAKIISELKAEEAARAAEAKPKDMAADHMYMVAVFGFDNNLRAKVFYDGSFHTAREGEEIADGVRVVEITTEKMVLSEYGKKKTIGVTAVRMLPEEQPDQEMQMMGQIVDPSLYAIPDPNAVPEMPSASQGLYDNY